MLVRVNLTTGYILINPTAVTDIYFQTDGDTFVSLANERTYSITQEESEALVKALGGYHTSEKPWHITWIVSAERGETRNSNQPLWRCVTEDGQRVNIFKHSDPEKDNFHLFEEAGYGELLEDISLFATVEFDPSICIGMVKNGQWWEIQSVYPADNEPVENEGCF